MKTLLAMFSDNWGLKILALVLAIVVYYSMKDDVRANPPDSRSNSKLFLGGPADGKK